MNQPQLLLMEVFHDTTKVESVKRHDCHAEVVLAHF